MDDSVFFYHDLLEGTEKSIRKDGVLWTETEDLGHCLALCALSVSKLSSILDTICQHFLMLLKQGSFCFFGLDLMENIAVYWLRKLLLKADLHHIHCTLYSIYLLKPCTVLHS